MKRVVAAFCAVVVAGGAATVSARAPHVTGAGADYGAVVPGKRGRAGAGASVAPTALESGASLTLAASCTLGENENYGATIVGSITGPGGVATTIGDSDWQNGDWEPSMDYQRSTTIAAPSEPGTYTFTVTCTTTDGNVYTASAGFEVIAPLPPPTTVATTTTPPTTTTTTTTTSTSTTSLPAAGTTTEISSSANPSSVGQPVTFTITIRSATDGSGSAPAGFRSVVRPRQVVAGGSLTISDGSEVLATVGVEGGQASFTTSELAAGTHVITAAFSGTATASPSSASLTQQVIAAVPPTTRPVERRATLPATR